MSSLVGVVVSLFLAGSPLLPLGRAHVSLQFPPARKYDLDFLDSVRTAGQCGMDAGSETTPLKSGSQINVTWHLGYPHGGGYRIELINGESVNTLVPVGGTPSDWEDSGSTVTQNHLVTLPETQCSAGCFIRLLRQATEWGQRYQFRSCSDIQLVSPAQFSPRCGDHGQVGPSGDCVCQRLYSGVNCQYRAGCLSDSDCNGDKGQGKCLLLDSNLFEDRRCFCSSEWFGENCEKENSWEASPANRPDLATFTKATPSPQFTLYHRITEAAEMEVVVEARTDSWVGLGWKPADITKSCQQFPADAPTPRGTDFNGMDCTDMVIGRAQRGLGSIGDYYTRDRSTPRHDSFWGGEDDLTSGAVWEEDGVTWMRFKKSLGESTADHSFQGKLIVIWAFGQNEGFYGEDQLKYHSRPNRGILSLDIPVTVGVGMNPAHIGLIIGGIVSGLLIIVQVIHNVERSIRGKK